ncbi:integrase core domain-containing protein [Pseudoalteromonas luteoviolacea]|uniref:Integrase catalytic domain-containing protein n=1 Tax=Pseudoalteromonas luteoviolacea S4054 TaxID=1129367 RepID=A0A0F6A582_9GAMM|nr:hypothetical protein S4054249_06940 [Pseudoalteromonas luteoviolacea]AOT12508.1 hypothetical protein S40542_06940 [Pseudoalteromonas luteoviolacea]AOT17422.1 hypothetical protein S4054_06940 [Pseudoalteromonas luteoviolacea]KKE81332.1 hypothetical protein N479_22615 [Pseudoalteromonas luteoviolacea S4054]KZN70659.1 hypothetical protein N481_20815 [Pseudoalteromonas luteoviolacea S4047-1]
MDLYLFESHQQVSDITEEWLDIYNYEWPHDALGEQTPMSCTKTEAVTLCRDGIILLMNFTKAGVVTH